ncbi:MAG: tyrosine-type recombinase/integrase [Rhizomicrobium sp.]
MMTHLLDDYMALRRAAGFQLRVQEVHLRNFVKFATERGEAFVRTQTALDWAALAPSDSQRGNRLDVVRIFARFARIEDSRHEVPPVGVFSSRRLPYRPFIFTANQIRSVLEYAARLNPAGSLRPWTYCTLFSLLAVTGMRISEALALRFDDITPDGLLIRKTKFQKSRLVPLHTTTQAGLDRYLQRRRHFGGDDDHVFISLRYRPPHYTTVQATFLQAVRDIGLHPGPGQRGPRLHDLRHSWAVAALEACPFGHDQVNQHVLGVSTYLGHAKLASTYVYLHTTPHLLADIAARCERVAFGVGP